MKYCIRLCMLTLLLALKGLSQQPGKLNGSQVLLPNGWKLSPAGSSLPLGDLPLNIVVSPTKKYLAVTNNGQSTQSIQLIDLTTKKILHTQLVDKSWYGLAFSKDEQTLFASGGNDNWILKYTITDRKSTRLNSSHVSESRMPSSA